MTPSKDMYSCVVSNLQYKIIRQILQDLFSKPELYTTIKNLVVKETDMSNYQRSEKLHALLALSAQRPSELLARIRTLQFKADCKCCCSRYQFFSRMPPTTWAQLVSKKDLTINQLAELADDITLSQTTVNNLVAEAINEHSEEVNKVQH